MDQARRRAERRAPEALVPPTPKGPPDSRARRGDRRLGVIVVRRAGGPGNRCGRCVSSPGQSRSRLAPTTRRAAQDSNPSHGAALLMGLRPV